jgi:3-oxoacid CoA-transferase subunit A
MINKVVKDADDAVRDIPDNAILMLGGFGLSGIPENCIRQS